MAWVRWGDAMAMHPSLLAVLEHPEFDDRLLNEVTGFVTRCAAQSGAHNTDYVVRRGTAIQIAGPTRVDLLLDVAAFAGLITEVEISDDGRAVTAYKLKDDDPEFLHLRLKKEIEWEQQRKNDSARPQLIVPVRLRDGDACRWCGCIVDWFDRRSGRAGTYDHLVPGEPATIDTYVVCCKSCNSSRRDGLAPNGRTNVLPAPAKPYFSVKTVEWLTDNEWRKSQAIPVPAPSATYVRPGALADGSQPPAPDGPADGSQPPATPQPDGTTVGSQATVAPNASAPPADRPSVSATADAARPGDDRDLAHGDRDPMQASGPHRTRVHPPASAGTGSQTTVAPNASAPSDDPGPPPTPDRATQDLQISARYQVDSADTQGPGSSGPGRVGSGRVGSPDSSPPTSRDSPRRRGRRGRRSRRPSPER